MFLLVPCINIRRNNHMVTQHSDPAPLYLLLYLSSQSNIVNCSSLMLLDKSWCINYIWFYLGRFNQCNDNQNRSLAQICYTLDSDGWTSLVLPFLWNDDDLDKVSRTWGGFTGWINHSSTSLSHLLLGLPHGGVKNYCFTPIGNMTSYQHFIWLLWLLMKTGEKILYIKKNLNCLNWLIGSSIIWWQKIVNGRDAC